MPCAIHGCNFLCFDKSDQIICCYFSLATHVSCFYVYYYFAPHLTAFSNAIQYDHICAVNYFSVPVCAMVSALILLSADLRL